MAIKSVLYNKDKQKVPVKIWEDVHNVESKALDQLKNIASLPFVFKHVAVMPDVHVGKGATVGSVIATKDAIIPAAVGVDIGCGMMAVKTELDPLRVQDGLKEIRKNIERSIPVAHYGNKTITKNVKNWQGWQNFNNLNYHGKCDIGKAQSQLGSLGGGNHFIEICLDKEDNVWVMLHSGSRNVGKSIAERHMHEAKGLMKKMFIGLPDPDLAYFSQGTPEFQAYWDDLQWAQEYAAMNRVEMMDRVLEQLARMFKGGMPLKRLVEVNCHHNYTDRENHFGENVLVTRKGAVRARLNDYGIIPGSMGTRSYIVKGKGLADSFCSCSHGAGRRMSRSAARKKFDIDDVVKQTAGVECRKDGGIIDELPGAYKDIDQVMANQSDLVEIIAELRQIVCVKG